MSDLLDKEKRKLPRAGTTLAPKPLKALTQEEKKDVSRSLERLDRAALQLSFQAPDRKPIDPGELSFVILEALYRNERSQQLQKGCDNFPALSYRDMSLSRAVLLSGPCLPPLICPALHFSLAGGHVASSIESPGLVWVMAGPGSQPACFFISKKESHLDSTRLSSAGPAATGFEL